MHVKLEVLELRSKLSRLDAVARIAAALRPRGRHVRCPHLTTSLQVHFSLIHFDTRGDCEMIFCIYCDLLLLPRTLPHARRKAHLICQHGAEGRKEG